MAIDRKALGPFGGSRPLYKKGFELQFHWIFVLVAGALILAFFFTAANKQREISQQRLQLTLATEMENIFTGAIMSRGTAQRLPIPPQGIEFSCTEGCACEFRIENAARQFGDKAMFAPEFLDDKDIVVWALELKLPYRVTNFLYLTNPNIKYYFVHKSDSVSQLLLQQITKNMPPFIEYENITIGNLPNLESEDYQHTKFVFLDIDPVNIDSSFDEFSAIKADQSGIAFYEQSGTGFTRTKYLSYIGLPSIYAAVFAQDDIMYECGLRNAFRKLSYISSLYAERAKVLQQSAFEAERTWCDYGATDEKTCGDPSTMTGMLCQQQEIATELQKKLDQSAIIRLNALKEQLDSQNRNFVQQSCPEIF